MDDIPALHAVVSDQYGSPCGAPSPIYVENCDFDRYINIFFYKKETKHIFTHMFLRCSSMFFALDFVLGGGLDPPSYDYDLANFLAFDQVLILQLSLPKYSRKK